MKANTYFDNIVQNYMQYDVIKPIAQSKKLYYELEQIEPAVVMYDYDNTLRISTEAELFRLEESINALYDEDEVKVIPNSPEVIYTTYNEENIERILDILSNEEDYIDTILSLKSVVCGKTKTLSKLTK